ncbi:c-type cytochrome [Roseicyclus sp. F158]|uniref:C-type cytochrome n=1 Tax=Tropicimonas omnivorans TaxID=3075590 RepID=A0ABU3DC93_9RHOB|nr:c-type cytochrome [Roseicyclus sp. F158]MDT0681285.1 c-type cytochrome [Roseicyclus sp. F158]
MPRSLPLLATLLLLPAGIAGAQEEGDAAAGEKIFARRCVSCHVIQTPEGETLAGRNGKIGPNLYGIANDQAGTREDFKYGKSLVEAGAEHGLHWGAAEMIPYLQDPTGYLREVTGDGRARSKMSFRLRKEQEAADVYSFLLSLDPEDAASDTDN